MKKAGLFFILMLLLAACYLAVDKADRQQRSVELGRYLFFDRRLSVNNTRACATCHNPQFAFTDGYKRSLGVFADAHQRNAQPLFNLSSYKYFTAADSGIKTLQQQMNNPLFATNPAEMGVAGHEEEILQRIAADKNYKKLFEAAKLSVNWPSIKEAIVSFMNTIESYHSPYDKFLAGDSNALTASAKRGKALFFSSELNCSQCHGGKNFSEPLLKNNNGQTEYFFNIGLYNIGDSNAYPAYDQGLFMKTKNINDMGKFRVPTLRNLAFTAPYFHDGSATTLMEAIDHFANGGRKISKGLYAGDGTKNKYKHNLIKGFAISEDDKANLAAFLLCLSDSNLLSNPLYKNPFSSDETVKTTNLQP